MKHLILTCATTLLMSQACAAQNLLSNSGFEDVPAAHMGNNLYSDISPWHSARADNGTYNSEAHNLVAVDGAGGFDYSYNGIANGPESDASAPGAGIQQHYLDSYPNAYGSASSHVWQYVRPACDGPMIARVQASNRLNHSGGNTTTELSIVTAAAAVPFPQGATYSAANTPLIDALFQAHDANKIAFSLPAGSTQNYPWQSGVTQIQAQAGQLYAVMVVVGQEANFDNVSVVTPNCSTVITPQDVTLFKSCQPPVPHTHNGILGQRWECQVDVTTASTPFSGDIILHDVFTDTALVEGEILLGESMSGNGSCFQGDCLITGANFDTSGTESFTFDIFVEATGEAAVYPLENCVTGEIDDGSGTMQPLTPHCTTGQWIPRSEVVKTCDPIPANATVPYTMNCTIEVTASGLVGGTYVSVMDAFAAQPPSIATVQPTFMNVTSTENWTCIDHQINTPSSIGICELPAEDLMAAGGTSTLDISFQFDVDQQPTQVANCRFTDIHQGSYLDKLSGQRSALRSPIQSGSGQNAGWPQMPDGCVYVDVPAPQLETKVETKITKDCDQPHLTNRNGTWGYLWQCQAEVEVTPSPFAGTVSFTDDGSQISMGTAEFVSTSDPSNCTGLGTDTLDCTYQGANFSSPHYVQYDLFTPYIQTDKEIDWKNCISGAAETPAGSFPSVPMCTGRIIKPADVPVYTPLKDIKLEKICEGAGRQMEHDGQTGLGWNCKIIITAGPAPFAGSFTFTEDASAITGSSGQIIAIDQAQPAHWGCAPSLPASATDCTIAGVNFDASGTETLDFTLFAPNTGEPVAWENCVGGVYTPGEKGDTGGEPREVKGNCQSIAWKPPVDDPAFEVEKQCKPMGERQVMGPSAWFQPWACTITVTSNGVPFNDPLWIDEDMLYGPHDGSQSVVSITSNDPWQCSPAPYGPNSNQPACGIQGNQFPHNTSTLDVTLNIFGGAADQFGAQNCVAVSMGDVPSNDPADVIAEDCFENIPAPEPKEPQIDLVKNCEPAIQNGSGQWSVACTLNITGQNLPNGQQFRVTDELLSSSTQTATFGTMNAGTNACGGGQIAGGTMASCDLTTDMINANGGTLTIPYTGTYVGPAGRPLNGPRAQNCAFVDIPGLGLHGPSGGNGKSCVPVEFKQSISSGVSDILIDPGTPTGGAPDVGGVDVTNPPLDMTGIANPIIAALSEPFIIKTCEPLIFAAGAQTAMANCEVTVGFPANGQRQINRITDSMAHVGAYGDDIVVGNMPPLTGLPQMGCAPINSPAATLCSGGALAHMSAGGTFTLNWTAEIERPQDERDVYRNCAALYYGQTSTASIFLSTCHEFEIVFEDGKAQDGASKPTTTPVPIIEYTLKTRKQQTSECVANRNTQRYTCGFRITVTNEGNAPFNGPLVVTDTFGSPYAQRIRQTPQDGWSCAQPVGLAVSCENSNLSLPQGDFTHIDLEMEVQGLVNGGQFENCAAAGVPDKRKQRVAAIQQVMNARGLAAGPVDGLPGKKTYAALAKLQRSLGLPVSREFDDALFDALGLPLAKPGGKSCVLVDLPRMPKPPLQCDHATTVQKGESCQCRYGNMIRRNATACQCSRGFAFVAGRGCIKKVARPKPDPTPAPLLETRTCDNRSTRLRGDECVCLDKRNAVKTSKTTCGCKNGGPMIGGKCLSIAITPKPRKPDATDDPVGTTEPKRCKFRLNGICIK